MATRSRVTTISGAVGVALVLAMAPTGARAIAPCGDLGECKALIEINATDGDIGFHFLMDGDDLITGRIEDPNGAKVFEEKAKGPLREQKLTETFAESAEPLCWDDPEAEPDEEIVTLEEFLGRWAAGTYVFTGMGEQGEKSTGETQLTYELPAAPSEVDFDGSVITWGAGNDLGQCATQQGLSDLVASGLLPVHPEFVTVFAWEVVLEPDVEDDDPTRAFVFRIRVPGSIDPTEGVTVPSQYLASLPADTPVKVEVGAIGADDNATFTEEDGFCVNEVAGCND